MRVMVLSNSEVVGGGMLNAEETWPALVAPKLTEAMGEPVEVFARQIWPDPGLPETVERWIAREDPDVVVYQVNSFWFLYESVPLRIGRWLGPLGKPFVNASLRAADTPWLTHNGFVRTTRKWAQRHIGGDTHFTTDEVIRVSKASIRAIAKGEGRTIVVRVPSRGRSYDYGPKSNVRRQARLAQVQEELGAFSKELHLEFQSGRGADEPEVKRTVLGDGIHSDAAGQVVQAEKWFRRLLPLCRSAAGERPDQPVEAGVVRDNPYRRQWMSNRTLRQ